MSDFTNNLARSDVLLLDVILQQRRHNDDLESALTQIGADRLDRLNRFVSGSIPLDGTVAQTALDVLILAADHFSGKRKQDILRLIGEFKGRGVFSQFAAAIHANPVDAITQRFGSVAGVPEEASDMARKERSLERFLTEWNLVAATTHLSQHDLNARFYVMLREVEQKAGSLQAAVNIFHAPTAEQKPDLFLFVRDRLIPRNFGETYRVLQVGAGLHVPIPQVIGVSPETILLAAITPEGAEIHVRDISPQVITRFGQPPLEVFLTHFNALPGDTEKVMELLGKGVTWEEIRNESSGRSLHWGKVSSDLARKISAQQMDASTDSYGNIPPVDLIFCLNTDHYIALGDNGFTLYLAHLFKLVGQLKLGGHLVITKYEDLFIPPIAPAEWTLLGLELVAGPFKEVKTADARRILILQKIAETDFVRKMHERIERVQAKLAHVVHRAPNSPKNPRITSDALLMDQPFVGAAGDVERELDQRSMPVAVLQALHGGVKLVSGGGGPFVRLVGSDGEGGGAHEEDVREKGKKRARRGLPPQPFSGRVTALPLSGAPRPLLNFMR